MANIQSKNIISSKLIERQKLLILCPYCKKMPQIKIEDPLKDEINGIEDLSLTIYCNCLQRRNEGMNPWKIESDEKQRKVLKMKLQSAVLHSRKF